MKRLVCEMCGSTDLLKDGGVFVCQSCGCKYTVEEARKMMVEGVVEVTGSVAIDNSANVNTWMDLARKSVEAQNGEQASDYADKVLQVDPSNAEAWFVKGRAALLQSTVGVDRRAEALKYFKESAAIVHGRLVEASADDIRLLRDIQKASTEMALTRALVFANNYSDHQSQEGLQRLLSMKSICNNVAISNAAVSAPLNENKERCLETLIADGMSEAAAERVYKEITDHEVESGQMYSGVAATLSNVANAIGRASITSWEGSGHIFDFFGLEAHNMEMGERREMQAWSGYIDGLDDDIKILLVAVELYERPETAKFFSSESKLDAAIKGCYENLIFLQKHARDARTNRRYHNRVSNSDRVTKDGLFLNESSKSQRNRQIANWEDARDSHDPWKRREKERRRAEEEARRRRSKATSLLERRYFEEHPDEQKALDAAQATIESSTKEQSVCVEQIKGLGLFKRKEQKRLEARIEELKADVKRAKDEIAAIEDRRGKWVERQLPGILKRDESDWMRPIEADQDWQSSETTIDLSETSEDASASISYPAGPFDPRKGTATGCFALRRVVKFDKQGQELSQTTLSYENGTVAGCSTKYNRYSAEFDAATMSDTEMRITTDGEGKPLPRSDSYEYQYKYDSRIKRFTTTNTKVGMSLGYSFDATGLCTQRMTVFNGNLTSTHIEYETQPDGRVCSYTMCPSKAPRSQPNVRHDVDYDEAGHSIRITKDGVLEYELDYTIVENPSKWLQLRSKVIIFEPPTLMYM